MADEVHGIISGSNVKTVIFVEEEIRTGGFGMLLSDAMRDKGYLDGIKYTVIAAEDAFVGRKVGQTYLCAAGLDAENIAKTINEMIH